ncbi:hypothetical protein EDC01DRAFT_670037 [Geopyxis carbonaria]|nr:hypothetical protein EDC01DRAFT_670037 [Geopyxis carbonaria]
MSVPVSQEQEPLLSAEAPFVGTQYSTDELTPKPGYDVAITAVAAEYQPGDPIATAYNVVRAVLALIFSTLSITGAGFALEYLPPGPWHNAVLWLSLAYSYVLVAAAVARGGWKAALMHMVVVVGGLGILGGALDESVPNGVIVGVGSPALTTVSVTAQGIVEVLMERARRIAGLVVDEEAVVVVAETVLVAEPVD